MRRYPEYKESGIEWLGALPAHWSVVPLKLATTFLSRGSSPVYTDESHIKVINQACIYWNGIRMDRVKYHEECTWTDLKGALESGDLLMNSTGTGTLGRAYLFDSAGAFIADSHITIIRFNGLVFPRFAFYVIQSSLYQGYVYATLVNGSTNQIELSGERLASTPFIVPPINEQRSIASYLDRKTAEIDTLIRKKQAMIELLTEQRTALINRAVTKGLDPNVPMKDSGIEWLGEVPEHWTIPRLKHVSSVRGRIGFRGYTTDDLVGPGEGALTLGATHIDWNGGIVLNDPVYISWEKYYESPEIMIQVGHILIVQRGSTCGKVGIVEGEMGPATINPSLVLLVPIDISSKFLLYSLSSTYIQNIIAGYIASTAIPMLSQMQIGNLQLPLPDTTEQQRIVEHLDNWVTRIDQLTMSFTKQISLLQELRTSLISEVVTGSIDVRTEVPVEEDVVL